MQLCTEKKKKYKILILVLRSSFSFFYVKRLVFLRLFADFLAVFIHLSILFFCLIAYLPVLLGKPQKNKRSLFRGPATKVYPPPWSLVATFCRGFFRDSKKGRKVLLLVARPLPPPPLSGLATKKRI